MISLTRIYVVDGRYVIAKSIEDAIRIFKEGEGLSPNDEIVSAKLISSCGKYPEFAYIEEFMKEDR